MCAALLWAAYVSSPASAAPTPTSPSAALSALEARHREWAAASMQRGEWEDAVLQWEVLHLLRPHEREYERQFDAARTKLRQATMEALSAASESRQRGEADLAMQRYLKVLRIDPGNETATQAVRAMERDHSRRIYFARGNRTPADKVRLARSDTASPAPTSATRRETRDAAIVTARQGDYEASVATLEKYLRQHPHDARARQHLLKAYEQLGQRRLGQQRWEEALAYLEQAQALREQSSPELASTIVSLREDLAETYYQRGVRAFRADLDQAIVAWERSLQYDPSQTQARVQLQQARYAQQKLQKIEKTRAQP